MLCWGSAPGCGLALGLFVIPDYESPHLLSLGFELEEQPYLTHGALSCAGQEQGLVETCAMPLPLLLQAAFPLTFQWLK